MPKQLVIVALLAFGLAIFDKDPLAGSASKVGHPGSRQLSSPQKIFDGDEVQVSVASGILPDANRYRPAVAYDSKHNEYLVVWHNSWGSGGRDVYARRVSRWGVPLGSPIIVSTGTKDRLQPAVAYSATSDNYLVVWMYDVSGNGTQYQIWGRFLAWNGIATGNEFLIFQWANRSFWSPALAWNSNHDEYLVIWNAMDTTTGLANDVAGRRILAASGEMPAGAPIIISDANNPHRAKIVYNAGADGYFVVWRRMYSSGDGDVWGALLKWDGALNGAAFAIDTSTDDQQSPAVATNGKDQYCVVWQQQISTTSWILKRILDSTGSATGIAIKISSDSRQPSVVAAGNGTNEYVTVWEQALATGTGIYEQQEKLQGNQSNLIFTNLVSLANFWESKAPAIAADPVSHAYFTVYEGDSTSDPTVYRHIYGRLWWADGAYFAFVPDAFR